jgi:hypothetical protein
MQPTLQTHKPIHSIDEEDLNTFPIWEFVMDEDACDEQDETWVRPVNSKAIPAGAYSLQVSVQYRTASGREFSGFIDVSTDGEVEFGGGAILYKATIYSCLHPKPMRLRMSSKSSLLLLS